MQNPDRTLFRLSVKSAGELRDAFRLTLASERNILESVAFKVPGVDTPQSRALVRIGCEVVRNNGAAGQSLSVRLSFASPEYHKDYSPVIVVGELADNHDNAYRSGENNVRGITFLFDNLTDEERALPIEQVLNPKTKRKPFVTSHFDDLEYMVQSLRDLASIFMIRGYKESRFVIPHVLAQRLDLMDWTAVPNIVVYRDTDLQLGQIRGRTLEGAVFVRHGDPAEMDRIQIALGWATLTESGPLHVYELAEDAHFQLNNAH